MSEAATYQTRLADAFEEGRAAALAGKSITASPYSDGSPMGEQWDSGWYEIGSEVEPEAEIAVATEAEVVTQETVAVTMIKPVVEPGPKPELLWIALDKLEIDPTYQREVGATNRVHANRIAREFRWDFCLPLCVARSGEDRYVIVDGQHRWLAALRHPDIHELPCWVISAASIEEQARAFKALNSARIGVSPLHRFWASLAAGEPMAIRIKGLCDKAGVEISKSKTKDLAPMSLACVTAIERATLYGDIAILATLLLIGEAQGHVHDAFRPATVGALVKIIHDDAEQFDRPAWVKTFRAIDIEATEAAARADRAKGGGSIEAAMEKRLRRAFERASARKAA